MLDLGVHGQIGSALFGDLFTRDEVVALDRTFGHDFVSLRPVAQGVTKPRRLRAKWGQVQLFPNLLGVFHELALGQSDRREVIFQGGIHQQGCILAMVSLASWAVSWIAVVQNLQIERIVCSVTHRPKERICIVGIDVVIDGNHKFSPRAQQRGGAVQSSPNFCGGRLSVDHHGDDFSQIREWLVHGDAFHAFDP